MYDPTTPIVRINVLTPWAARRRRRLKLTAYLGASGAMLAAVIAPSPISTLNRPAPHAQHSICHTRARRDFALRSGCR